MKRIEASFPIEEPTMARQAYLGLTYAAAAAKRRSGSIDERSMLAPASNFLSSGITVAANRR